MEFVDWVRELAPKPHDIGYRFPDISPAAKILAQPDDGYSRDIPKEALHVPSDPYARAKVTGSYTQTAPLDQVNVAIDYTDASGVQTRRPITIQEISSSNSYPVITALCHMRGEVRSFRVDRIDAIITKYGEVIDPATYIRDMFSIDLMIFAKADPEDSDDPLAQARRARDSLRPMLSILVLAARVDGEYHPEELDVILRYAEQELLEMERLGRLAAPITLPMLDQLTKVVRQMRPTVDTVGFMIAGVERLNGAAQKRFWKALEEVICADGKVTQGEEVLHAMVSGFASKARTTKPFKGEVIAFSGTFPRGITRAMMNDAVIRLGGIAFSWVKEDTTILIFGLGAENSLAEAKRFGVREMAYPEFAELAGLG